MVGVPEALAFLCELAAVALLAVAGWSLGSSAATRPLLAVLLPLALVAWWTTLLAPRARRRLRQPVRYAVQCLVFVVVGALTWWAGHPAWAVALVVLGVVAFGLTGRREAGTTASRASTASR